MKQSASWTALSAAALLSALCSPAAMAQSITTAGTSIASVPIGGALVLAALVIALAIVATRKLHRVARLSLLLLVTALMAGASWNGQPAWAQVLAQFTNPNGETRPILVTPNATGFESAHFLNASGSELRITAIAPPDFNACFPTGFAPVLPPATTSGPSECVVGQTLAAGATCQVNVDAICKALANQAQATLSVTPTSLSVHVNTSAVVTVTNDAASPVTAQNIIATIPGSSTLTLQINTCSAALTPGTSCALTLTGTTTEGPTTITIQGSNTPSLSASITVTPPPQAIIEVTPTNLSFAASTTGIITVTNTTGSPVAAQNVAATIPAGSTISVQSTTCGPSLAIGGSCTITFASPAVEGPTTVTVSGDNSNALSLSITASPPPQATLTVTPANLVFTTNATGIVTVTNTASSPVAAQNVAAAIPAGSAISVQSTTCGASLAIGGSCTITFASPAVEGPTTVTVSGDNSNALSVSLTVQSPPTITIDGPQTIRIIPVGSGSLALSVTNTGAATAYNITVTNKTAAPNIVVGNSNCASLSPGQSCNLLLSSLTPYAPALLTIGGSNTANSPTTEVAFSYANGFVFETSASGGKVVSMAKVQTSWTDNFFNNIAGAESSSDGLANTNAIVADSACASNPAACAAQQCRNLGADWYLPAVNELITVLTTLCANGTNSCIALDFSENAYWSSTQTSGDSTSAETIYLHDNTVQTSPISLPKSVDDYDYRCIKSFTH